MSNPGEGAVPPAQIMMNYMVGLPVSRMIGVAAELGIPSLLGQGAKTAGEVAHAAGTKPEPTYRLMRALATLGVLAEDSSRSFSLTAVGECLLPDRPGSFDALAKLNNTSWMTDAYARLVHSLKTGGAGFDQAHGQGLFQFLAARPAEQELFGRAMSTFSGMEVALVLGAYDFSRARHIVDVGGGHGLLLSQVLAAAPSARGTLFDMPEVAKQAKTAFAAAASRTRFEVVGGDFFSLAPAGGDLYLLKHILHDWDDARATKILEAVSKAMSPGARVLVIEQGIAAPGVPNPGKVTDVVMLMLLEGGRERTAEEHAALFERVGIRFEREITTPGPITLFEGVRL
jgi:hypothetical protein